MRILQKHISSNFNWLNSVITILIVGGGAKLLAIVKDAYLASELGIGDTINNYFLLLLIPVFIANSLSSSIANVILPNARKEEFLRGAFGYFLKLFFVAFSIALVVSIVYLKFYQVELWLELSVPYVILFLLTFVVVLQGINAYLLALVESEGKFYSTPFHSVFLSVSTVFAIWYSVELINLIIAFFASYLLMTIFLVFNISNKKLLIPLWSNVFNSTAKNNYKILILSALIGGAAFFIDQLMADYYFYSGISIVQYAFKITLLISSFLALAFGNVLLKEFSTRSKKEGDRLLLLSSSFILLICLFIALLIWYFSFETVALFFERGKFSIKETEMVVPLLKIYAFTIPFYVLIYVFGVYLASRKAYRRLLIISVLSLCSNVVFNYLFIKQFGISGIALSTVVSFLLVSLLSVYYSKQVSIE